MATVGPPTQYSRRRPCEAAYTIARAATSGWKTGATGRARPGIRFSTHSNCGVLTAGSCTIVVRTPLPECSSSQRSDSLKPWMACLAPQYADCSGTPR